MTYLNTVSLPRRGFLLHEVMVGVVIFGIAMYPILRALVLLPRVAAYAGEQARAESWRSASDGFAALGVDAEQSTALHSAASDLNVERLELRTTRRTLSSQQGAPQITLISEEASNIPEERAHPMGLEIGAGSLPNEPRSDPLAPLPEVKLAKPSLSPDSGTFLNAVALLPIAGGYGGQLHARAANSTDRVFLQENAPENQRNSATGSASLLMSAQALALAYTGVAWSEFPGNQETDTQILLEDGRARWLVKIGQRVQVYQPSDAVSFIYGVDLGRPIYDFAGEEYFSGSQVPVNFVDAQSVSSGANLAMIAYPAEVRERFGADWTQIEPRFKWTFGASVGDSSAGNTASIFSAGMRSQWNDSQTLSVAPDSTLAGVRAWAGSWTLVRSAITLGPPERLSAHYDSETDEAGVIEFSAPVLVQTGLRVGRPEIDGVESVGSTLSSVFVP